MIIPFAQEDSAVVVDPHEGLFAQWVILAEGFGVDEKCVRCPNLVGKAVASWPAFHEFGHAAVLTGLPGQPIGLSQYSTYKPNSSVSLIFIRIDLSESISIIISVAV